jgi:hypothetical protein
MATDYKGKRLDDEDTTGWWEGLLDWLARIRKPDNFFARNPKCWPDSVEDNIEGS